MTDKYPQGFQSIVRSLGAKVHHSILLIQLRNQCMSYGVHQVKMNCLDGQEFAGELRPDKSKAVDSAQ